MSGEIRSQQSKLDTRALERSIEAVTKADSAVAGNRALQIDMRDLEGRLVEALRLNRQDGRTAHEALRLDFKADIGTLFKKVDGQSIEIKKIHSILSSKQNAFSVGLILILLGIISWLATNGVPWQNGG